MDIDKLKKLLKKAAIVAAFFVLGAVLAALGPAGRPFLLIYVLIVAILMVLAILLQAGRGGGLASLGGLSGDSLLGTRSATPIAKATYVLGGLFLFLCMLIAWIGQPPEVAKDVLQGGEQAFPTAPAGGAGMAPETTQGPDQAAPVQDDVPAAPAQDVPAAPESEAPAQPGEDQ